MKWLVVLFSFSLAYGADEFIELKKVEELKTFDSEIQEPLVDVEPFLPSIREEVNAIDPILTTPPNLSPETAAPFPSAILESPTIESFPVLPKQEELTALTVPSFTQPGTFAGAELSAPQMVPQPRYKSPLVTLGLAYLFPGLGHFYLGDSRTASELMGVAGTSIGLIPVTAKKQEFLIPNVIVLQSTWQYGIYAAYRDMRIFNQQTGYTHRMPMDSFTDLVAAPFSWKVLKKPEVWGGFLGAMTAAFAVGYFGYADKEAHLTLSTSLDNLGTPFVAMPVGIGEEALFRGFIQSELIQAISPRGGILATALAFGAAHIPNAFFLESDQQWRYYTYSLPLITALGAYFGWVTEKNHSLQESVALHSWYDFTLFALNALTVESAASTTRPRPFAFAIPLSF